MSLFSRRTRISSSPENDEQIDNSLSGLQKNRNELVLKRKAAQRSYNRFLPISIILSLLGILFAWWFYTKMPPEYQILSIVNFIYFCLPITFLPSIRMRLRQIENDIQELDFRIDLQEFDVSKQEMRAEKLLRLNDFQLHRYYNLNISQNYWVFGLGVFCIILGIAVIAISLYLVLNKAHDLQTQIITGVLGSIGAILTNFIAVIYLKMNTTATENLTAFHSRLIETQQLLLGNLLASRIENDEKRWETLSQLSLHLVDKDSKK